MFRLSIANTTARIQAFWNVYALHKPSSTK